MNPDALYLFAGGTRGWRWERGTLATGEPVTTHAFMVIVDVAEETLSRQAVPRLLGRDRRALRARRLRQEFPETTWRSALSLGPGTEPRTEELVLVGIQPPPDVASALARAAACGTLCGVYTPALLAANWVRRATAKPGPTLVALETVAGLRLMFLDRGRPLLSRLAPWPADVEAPGRLARLGSEELSRTLSYLQNVRWIERGSVTDLWLWGERLQPLREQMTLPRELRHVRTPKAASLPDPEVLGLAALVAVAARRLPAAQLAPDEARLGWLAGRARLMLLSAAAAVAVACGVVAAGIEVRSAELRDEAATVQAETDGAVSSAAALERIIIDAGLVPERMAVALAVDASMDAGPLLLRDALEAAGQALAQSAALSLDMLTVRRVDPAPDGSGVASGCTPPLEGDAMVAPVPPRAVLGLGVRSRPEATLTTRVTSLRALDDSLAQLPGWRPVGRVSEGALNDTLRLQDADAADADASLASVCVERTPT